MSRGGSVVKLQAIMGHASIRTTQAHHAHLAPDAIQGSTSILDGLGTAPPEPSEISTTS